MTEQSAASTSMAKRWHAMVVAEHAQSDRARGSAPVPADFWQGLSAFFRQDPRRTGDLVIERLARDLSPEKTLLDVGAGAGRLALPLAFRCRHVTAVEPSTSMAQGFRAEAEGAGLSNVMMVQATWEEAQVPKADMVLCSNVLYTVRDAEAFLRKLDRHAVERVLVILHVEPPVSFIAPFWRMVHGEERLRLPALRELVMLLWEMDIYPDVEMLPTQPRRGWATREEARQQLRGRLFVTPGSPQDTRLEHAMGQLLEEVEGKLLVRGSAPQRPALVSWEPSH